MAMHSCPYKISWSFRLVSHWRYYLEWHGGSTYYPFFRIGSFYCHLGCRTLVSFGVMFPLQKHYLRSLPKRTRVDNVLTPAITLIGPNTYLFCNARSNSDSKPDSYRSASSFSKFFSTYDWHMGSFRWHLASSRYGLWYLVASSTA